MYGYAEENAPFEIVNLRVRLLGPVEKPKLEPRPVGNADPRQALMHRREVQFAGQKITTPFFAGESLEPGNFIPGPAIVQRLDTTVLIGQTDTASVDGFGNLLISVDTFKRANVIPKTDKI
jgi:N-methylhydantoinase A/oxoprolinase/acetone carboxylase beta subunit